MSVRRWQTVGRPAVVALVAALAAAMAAGQIPEFADMVEVRVVNVDVVVTDSEGRLVRGLEKDDFELLVKGEPVPIDYFSAFEDSRPVASPAAAVEGAVPEASRPFLAIAYDARSLHPGRVRSTVEALRGRLGELLERTRAIMVVRHGPSLAVEQPLTREPELLDAALQQLSRRRIPKAEAGLRDMLMRQLESTEPPGLLAYESEDERVIEVARALLQQIRSQAELERHELVAVTDQLRSLVRTLSGLPGRKSILYLGEGLQTRPAEPLFRVWWEKYSRYAHRLGILNIETEMAPVRSDHSLTGLIGEANVHRVSFYSYDPGGLRPAAGTAEFATAAAYRFTNEETESRLNSLLELAVATGGVGRTSTANIAPVVDAMLAGFGNYYSLGFEPRDGLDERGGRVRVRLREPGLELRYMRRFAVRTPARELEEATLAALLTEGGENPLQVAVEFGTSERQPDGTYLVPVLVKVPVARLVLLPQAAQHVGKISFVIMARSASGDLSPPAHGEVPIEIANAELPSAMGRIAGYRLRVRVKEGEQRVAIGVRDEVGREDATVSLTLAPRRGT